MIRIARVTIVTVAMILCLNGMVMSPEAQAQRFVDNGDGTVTDTMTNLMWTKDANPFVKLNWDDAMSACSSFSISGIGGWRLPSRDELVALSSAMQGEHPFTGFGQLPYYYWSSTTAPDCKGFSMAWTVDMEYGDFWSTIMADQLYVWCVRNAK